MWVQRTWQKIKTNHSIWVNHTLVTLFGTLFICHQQGPPQDMGTPPAWEKGSHLPPGTTKLGKLRDTHDSSTVPTAKPDSGILLTVRRVLKCGAHPGIPEMWWVVAQVTLNGLVGSHTRLVIYPPLQSAAKGLWSVLCSIPGSRGCR